MEIRKSQIIGLALAFLIVLVSLFFMQTKIFTLLIGMGFLIGAFPFVLSLMHENKIANEKEEMFLEFARDLVESVKAGTPINRSITNIRNKPYGALNPHIQKLSNQIHIGVPLRIALETFSKDANNKAISRALTLIGQAEQAGGDISEILEAVANAVSTSDKLKKERKSAISTLVVQGYIIFFVFIAIVLVMEFQILPMLSGVSSLGDIGVAGLSVGGGGTINAQQMANAFLYMLLVQGFFTGLTIGKLAEGNVKAGVKHSFALMLIAFLISTGANIIMTH